MDSYTPEPRRRSRRSERALRENEPREAEAPRAETPETSESASAAGQPDWSAYYRRPEEGTEETAGGETEYAYAPPVKLRFRYPGYLDGDEEPSPLAEETQEAPRSELAAPANVYHPREAGWAQPEEEKTQRRQGYLVEETERSRPSKKKGKGWIVVVCCLAALCVCAFLFQEPLTEIWDEFTGKSPKSGAPSAAVTTPAPFKSYNAASPVSMSDRARAAISELAGALSMEPRTVKESSILTRSAREDGSYDYYLFSAAEGRLLCYFEALGENDAFPMPGGGYYVRQKPWLVDEDGSAMLDFQAVEGALGESVLPHPMMNGWAALETGDGRQWNLMNGEGELLSPLWCAKLWPMTGEWTLGYVDVGNPADPETRYTLYRLGSDGSCVKLRSEARADGVIVSACGAAYLDSGEAVLLARFEEPLMVTDEMHIYVDCDAMVLRDPESGKYGLYVHGQQQYDFLYDSIQPAQSDLEWKRESYQGAGGSASLWYVTGASYPQPLSHYFLLKRGETEEYVALSTASACPVELR